MAEAAYLEQRVAAAERDVRTLADKLGGFAVSQAQTNTKLDSMLVGFGELKESVNRLEQRPGAMWDRLVSALLGALAAGTATAALTLR